MKIIDDRLDKKRITVVTGHYGSGKTEFSVNYALYLARCGYQTALVDLDIANPYFRSREQQQYLAEMGVKVYGNAYGYEITAEIPAVNAAARGPLEDPDCRVVVWMPEEMPAEREYSTNLANILAKTTARCSAC